MTRIITNKDMYNYFYFFYDYTLMKLIIRRMYDTKFVLRFIRMNRLMFISYCLYYNRDFKWFQFKAFWTEIVIAKIGVH